MYHWRFDASMPICAEAYWKQMPRKDVIDLCDRAREYTHPACAIGCVIVSTYSEAEAAWIDAGDDESIRIHERKHVLRRLRHP